MDEIKNFGRLRLQTNGPHCLQIGNIPYNDSDHDNHLPTIILLKQYHVISFFCDKSLQMNMKTVL